MNNASVKYLIIILAVFYQVSAMDDLNEEEQIRRAIEISAQEALHAPAIDWTENVQNLDINRAIEASRLAFEQDQQAKALRGAVAPKVGGETEAARRAREEADAAFARAMHEEEQRTLDRERAAAQAEADRRNALEMLARQEQLDADARLAAELAAQFAEVNIDAAAPPRIPLVSQLEVLHNTIRFNGFYGTHFPTVVGIAAHLEAIPQDADVHVLDSFVAGNMAAVNQIGVDLDVGNPNLTAEEIKGYLHSQQDRYAGYEGQPVTPDQLGGYIEGAVNTATGDAATLNMFSRAVSLIRDLDEDWNPNNQHLKHLFDGIAENYLTRGGCFEGVRNRTFIRYISTLRILMQG